MLIVYLVAFQELNAEPVIPENFPGWVDVMNGWGHKMIAAVEVCFFSHSDMVYYCTAFSLPFFRRVGHCVGYRYSVCNAFGILQN